MNRYRLITGIALVIGTINGFPADQDPGTGEAQAEQPGGSEKHSTTSGSGGTSVELIVGGSGEDGVAKRREMPLRK